MEIGARKIKLMDMHGSRQLALVLFLLQDEEDVGVLSHRGTAGPTVSVSNSYTIGFPLQASSNDTESSSYTIEFQLQASSNDKESSSYTIGFPVVTHEHVCQ